MLVKEDFAITALAKQLDLLVLHYAVLKVALLAQDRLEPVELRFFLIKVDFSFATVFVDKYDGPLLLAIGI